MVTRLPPENKALDLLDWPNSVQLRRINAVMNNTFALNERNAVIVYNEHA